MWTPRRARPAGTRTPNGSAVRTGIAGIAAKRAVTIASVECARGASLSHAGSFDCVATRTSGARDLVEVTVSPDGRWSWTSPTL